MSSPPTLEPTWTWFVSLDIKACTYSDQIRLQPGFFGYNDQNQNNPAISNNSYWCGSFSEATMLLS